MVLLVKVKVMINYRDKLVKHADGKLFARHTQVKPIAGNGSGGGKQTLNMLSMAGCGDACGISWHTGASMDGRGKEGDYSED